MSKTIPPIPVVLIVLVCSCVEKANANQNEVPELVAQLRDPDNEIRAKAAASLRRILATDPNIRSNDHGQHYWQERLAKVEPGMTNAEVTRFFPIYEGSWVGSQSRSWWLDHYWFVTAWYDRNDKLMKLPVLGRRVFQIWVVPPLNYSGTWVTWFVNGKKSNEIECVKGQYHGTNTSYHVNGQKRTEQHYVNGVCSGTDIGWNRNGSKTYAGQYKNGKQEGTWTHWDENGSVVSRRSYKNGKSHGVHELWNSNGKKHLEIHYWNGKKRGLERSWDEEGNLRYAKDRPS